ncbi:hypothetical protein GCM10018965_072730 [Nonomuraea roseola]
MRKGSVPAQGWPGRLSTGTWDEVRVPGPGPLIAGDPEWIGGHRLIGVLGDGGQGVVYLGQEPSGRQVAVKVLHARMAVDPKARERFLREAEVTRRVAAFCTATVLDMGISGERPYLVSEYIPGPSLRLLVADNGPRTGSGLDRLAVATLTALAAIHRVGIVHRDFKPDNVIMGPEGPDLTAVPGYLRPDRLHQGPAGTRLRGIRCGRRIMRTPKAQGAGRRSRRRRGRSGTASATCNCGIAGSDGRDHW